MVMGGWDPVSHEPLADFFAYDFATCRWEQRSPMPSRRSFFAAAGFAWHRRVESDGPVEPGERGPITMAGRSGPTGSGRERSRLENTRR